MRDAGFPACPFRVAGRQYLFVSDHFTRAVATPALSGCIGSVEYVILSLAILLMLTGLAGAIIPLLPGTTPPCSSRYCCKNGCCPKR